MYSIIAANICYVFLLHIKRENTNNDSTHMQEDSLNNSEKKNRSNFSKFGLTIGALFGCIPILFGIIINVQKKIFENSTTINVLSVEVEYHMEID